MQPEQKARLREFYNQLADQPLEPDHRFYEPFVGAIEAEGDPIADLATRITWSEAASVNLLSGQRGSGKSTELRRLRKLLREEDCEVFLCDMRDYMNLTTPVEITDFLMSVMGALNEAVYERYHENISRESYWERLLHFLNTDVEIKDLKLETAMAGTKAGIQQIEHLIELLQDSNDTSQDD